MADETNVNRYVVVDVACLECCGVDSGQHRFLGVFATREEADTFVGQQDTSGSDHEVVVFEVPPP